MKYIVNINIGLLIALFSLKSIAAPTVDAVILIDNAQPAGPLTDVSINDSANNTRGVLAINDSIAKINNANIITAGSYSSALSVGMSSKLELTGSYDIKTSGQYSYGLEVIADPAGYNGSTLPLDKSSKLVSSSSSPINLKIETDGFQSHGIQVRDSSSVELHGVSGSYILAKGDEAEAVNTNDINSIIIDKINLISEKSTGIHLYGSGESTFSNLSIESKGSTLIAENTSVPQNMIVNFSNVIAEKNNDNLITNITHNSSKISYATLNINNNSSVSGTSKLEGLTSVIGETNINVDGNSVWKILDNSEVTNLSNRNNSIIDLTKKGFTPTESTLSSTSFNTLTVYNDYIGDSVKSGNNGKLIVNTVWNNNSSISDRLAIKGTASGYTEVQTKSGIIGNVTSDSNEKYSANVITVDNHSIGSNNFYGFSNTAGAEQAILVQKDANNYAWYLPSASEKKPINPIVPGPLLMPKANLNAGYSILGTLHERVSEQQTKAWDNCSTCQIENNNGQVWGRIIGNYNKTEGKTQYDYRSKLWGVQFGYDFDVNYDKDNNSRSHTGIMFTYGKDNVSFYNSKSIYFNTSTGNYAEMNSKTGHGQSDIYNLGMYHTYYDKNGSYLDLVGMFNYIQNKYTTDGYGKDKNKAYGPLFSVEVGRPFSITNNGLHNGDWLIEPQAQLIYQYLKYDNYKTADNINVDQNSQQGLRGRLGARIAYNKGNDKLKTQTIYFTGNIIHDFLNPKRIDFGTSTVNEKIPKTVAEVGVGVQLPLSNTSYVYFDTRYFHSLDNSDGKTKGVSGTLGLKYYW